MFIKKEVKENGNQGKEECEKTKDDQGAKRGKEKEAIVKWRVKERQSLSYKTHPPSCKEYISPFWGRGQRG